MSKNNLAINVQFTDGKTRNYNQDLYGIKKWIIQNEKQIPSDQILIVDVANNTPFDLNTMILQTKLGKELNLKVVDPMRYYKESQHLKKVNDELQQQLNSKQQEFNTEKEQHQKLSNDYIAYKQQMEQNIINNNTKLSDVMKRNQQEIENITTENNEKISSLNNVIYQLQGEIAQLKQQISNLHITIKNNESNYTKILQNTEDNSKKELEKFQTEKDNQIAQLESSYQSNYGNLLGQYNNICLQAQQLYAQLQNTESIKVDLEQQLSIQKEETESFNKKYQNEKTKNEKAEDQIQEIQRQLNTTNTKLTTKTKEVQQAQQKYNDIEQELEDLKIQKDSNMNTMMNHNSEQLKNIKTQLNTVQIENNQLKEQLENVIQERNQITQINIVQKQKNETLEKELSQLQQKHQNQTNKDAGEIERLKKMQSQGEKDISTLKKDIQQKESELSQQKLDIQRISEEIDKLKKNNIQQNNSHDQTQKNLDKEIEDLTNKNKLLREEVNTKQQECIKMHTEKTTTEGELNVIKNQFQQLKDQNTRQMKQVTDSITQFEIENNKLMQERNLLEKILQQISETQVDKSLGKSKGLSEVLLKDRTIKSYFDDKNGMYDDRKYELFQVTKNDNLMEQQFKNNNILDLENAVKLESNGDIAVSASIQKSQDTDLFSGFLVQVNECQNAQLKGKHLLRIELKLKQNYVKKEDAIKLSLNSLICQFLLQRFKKDIKTAGIKCEFDLTITDQFILKLKDKDEYFYAFVIEDGPLTRINGGEIDINKSQIDQFCNSFSLYTYYLMQRQGVISFISVQNNKYLFDMIYSSKYKCVSPIDQGKLEIGLFMNKVQTKIQEYFGPYFNDKLQKLAEVGFGQIEEGKQQIK